MVSILGQVPGLTRYILCPEYILVALAYFPATLSYARKSYITLAPEQVLVTPKFINIQIVRLLSS
jgi:hypothetical protein